MKGTPLGSPSPFAKNVYSQNGEDGIIWEMLDRIETGLELTRWCVEFGAWDGEYLSNTCNLIRRRDFRAVLIEGNPRRVKELNRNHPGSDVEKIHAFVAITGEKTLDGILQGTGIPREFDVLSIDVDGCDYWIFESLREHFPRVVVIEFNPTIPNSVSYVQEPGPSVKRGSSARALTELANRKGYGLVAVTSCNLIFVRSDIAHLVGVDPETPPSLDDLRDDSDCVVHAFVGFDGTLILSKDLPLYWHESKVSRTSAQPLPRIFRKYPGDWGPVRRKTYRIFRLLRRLVDRRSSAGVRS